jgi:hypothetical protein
MAKQCGGCGKGLSLGKNGAYVRCVDKEVCKAIAWEKSFKTTFTKKEMVELVEGETIYKRGLIDKNGKKYSGWVYFNFDGEGDERRVMLNTDKEHPPVFTCQINDCGGDVLDKGVMVVCSSCNRKSMNKQGGVEVSLSNQERIFKGETITLIGLTSKDKIDEETKEKKIYDADLRMGDEWAGLVFDTEINDEDLEEVDDNKELLGAHTQQPPVETKTVNKEADEMFPDDEIDVDAAIMENN